MRRGAVGSRGSEGSGELGKEMIVMNQIGFALLLIVVLWIMWQEGERD